jgi:hypothetical protein
MIIQLSDNSSIDMQQYCAYKNMTVSNFINFIDKNIEMFSIHELFEFAFETLKTIIAKTKNVLPQSLLVVKKTIELLQENQGNLYDSEKINNIIDGIKEDLNSYLLWPDNIVDREIVSGSLYVLLCASSTFKGHYSIFLHYARNIFDRNFENDFVKHNVFIGMLYNYFTYEKISTYYIAKLLNNAIPKHIILQNKKLLEYFSIILENNELNQNLQFLIKDFINFQNENNKI